MSSHTSISTIVFSQLGIAEAAAHACALTAVCVKRNFTHLQRRPSIASISSRVASCLLSVLLLWTTPAQAGQLFFSQNGYGANEIVRVSGEADFISNCVDPNGKGEGRFDLFPTVLIHVVSDGTIDHNTILRTELIDLSGSPNLVQGSGIGGSFYEQVIATTKPGGNLGMEGIEVTYQAVLDECMDGYFNPGEDSWTEFTVSIPANISQLPSAAIHNLKEKAEENAFFSTQALSMAAVVFILDELVNLFYDPTEKKFGGMDIKSFIQTFVCPFQDIKSFTSASKPSLSEFIESVFPDPKLDAKFWACSNFEHPLVLSQQPSVYTRFIIKWSSLLMLFKEIEHQLDIAADPPDPDFFQPVFIDHLEPFSISTGDPVEYAIVEVARNWARREALSKALLGSLEKYQGAQLAGSGIEALMHARNIKHYAALLVTELNAGNSSIDAFLSALQDNGRDVEHLADVFQGLQEQIVTQGVGEEDRQFLKNMGLSEFAISTIDQYMTSFDFGIINESGGLVPFFNSYESQVNDYAAALNLLALNMDSIIGDLEGVLSIQAPVANAGGPYFSSKGNTVHFDGSSSIDMVGGGLTYTWDLDGDGSFNDASGSTPSFIYHQSTSSLIGLRVVDSAERSDVSYASLEITETNRPPVIEGFSPSASQRPDFDIGTSIQFDVQVVDPDSDPVAITWFLDDQPAGTGSSFIYNAQVGGMHFLRVEASDGHLQGGISSYSRNLYVLTPDFAIDRLDIDPLYPTDAEAVTLTIEVKNDGLVDAENIAVSLSVDDVPLGPRQVIPFLAAGAASSLSTTIDVAGLGGETISIAAQVDPDDAITEANEDDNAKARSLYVRNNQTGGPELLTTLLNPDPNSIQLGTRVAGSVGGHILASATGAVYLYDGNAESATLSQVLHTFADPVYDGYRKFGTALAAYGDFAVIGDPYESRLSGAAYLFDVNPDSPTFGNLLQTFVNPLPYPYDWFGWSVAVADKIIAIGAMGDELPEGSYELRHDAGTVFIYDGDPHSPTFGQLLKSLWNPDPSRSRSFGYSVARVGKNILVGAPSTDQGTLNSGAAYLYDGDPHSPAFGTLLQTFYSPEGIPHDGFGDSVAGMGTTILVGSNGRNNNGYFAEGKVYLFDGNPASSTFGAHLRTLRHPSPSATGSAGDVNGFGTTIATVGESILVGVAWDDLGAENAGAVYLYDGDRTSPTFGEFLSVFVNPDPLAEDQFGFSLGVSGSDMLVGARFDDPQGTNADCTTCGEFPEYQNPGAVYRYSLGGAGGSATFQLPASAASGPYAGYEGSAVSVEVVGDFDGQALQFRWDFDGDGLFDTEPSSLQEASHVYLDDYSGNATVEAIDASGQLSSIATASIAIENVAPTVDAGWGATLDLGSSFSLSASFTDPGVGDTHLWHVDWGDGAITLGIDSENDGRNDIATDHIYAAPGDYTVTVTVTDDDGGSDADQVQVTVDEPVIPDVTPPVISLRGDNPARVELGATYDDAGATATDDIDGDVSSRIDAVLAVNTGAVGTYAVIYTVSDLAGNAATAIRTVHVIDSAPPVVVAPDDVTAEANGLQTQVAIGTATATSSSGIASLVHDAPDTFPLGTTIVTWTATDAAGKTSAATQLVHVVDTTSPEVTAPAAIIGVEATGPSTPIDIGTATASDAVGVLSLTSDAPPHYPLGETTVTWTATDAAGNVGTAAQTVEVVDTTPPAMTDLADRVLEGTHPGGASVGLSVLATDTADPVLDYRWVDGESGELGLGAQLTVTLGLGTHQLSVTATDDSGNSATATLTVVVQDTTPPTLTVPAHPLVLEAQSAQGVPIGDEAVSAFLDAASAADICDPDPQLTSNAPEQFFPLGETVVAWTATDASGNSISKAQKVSVVDTTPPAIIAITEDMIVEGSNPIGEKIELSATATDAADPSPSYLWKEGDAELGKTAILKDVIFALGTHEITVTITDDYSNQTTATVVVTVQDTTPPELVYTVDLDELWPPNHQLVQVISDIAGFDLCDLSPAVAVAVESNEPLNGPGDGNTEPDWQLVDNAEEENGDLWVRSERSGKKDGRIYTITLSATDASGNSSSEVVTVVIGHDKGEGRAKTTVLPEVYELFQNAPNPFNMSTRIAYQLPKGADVSLVIYDILGRPIHTLVLAYQGAGSYQIAWDGRDDDGLTSANGVYFYHLISGDFQQTRRMLLLK